jgi:salicylate hydroxylase
MALRVLVAGGGIGGLAAALALARDGHRIELLEQAAVFSEIGAGIQLGPNAMRRLAALGVAGEVEAVAAHPGALVVADASTGREFARMPLGDAMRAHYGARYCCVHRADLHAVLAQAVRLHGDAVALHLDSRIVRVEDGRDAVGVTTQDARSRQADALVGADGLWRAVRPAVVNAESVPRVTGHTAWRGLIAQDALPPALRSGDVRVWLGPRMHAVAYPVRRGEALNVVVLAESPPAGDARDWDQPGSLAALHKATGRCAGPLQALIGSIGPWRAWTLCDREPLAGPSEMARGRIALLGDAAHPMLPYLAQGAGMAIEDALALAEALRDVRERTADVPAALGRYARARWRRDAQVQSRARRNARIFHLTGPMRLGRDLALRTFGRRLLDVPWLYGG